VKYSQIYVAVDQRYVAHERRRPAQKIVQTLVEYDQQSDYVSEKERNEGREIQKICVTQAFTPDCAVKDLWSKEREKKDKRSSGLG